MNNLNLYMVFLYGNSGFQVCARIVSELSWNKISEGYIEYRLIKQKPRVLAWSLVDERKVDTIKYSELNLLDDVILVDNDCREGDITEFRREFIMRKLAGI